MSQFATIGRLFRRSISSEVDLYRLVHAGVPASVYSRVERRLAIPKGTIGSERSLRKRLKEKAARLTPNESERLLGITRLFAHAISHFGDENAALAWMHRPAQLIAGRAPVKPIELAVFASGVRFLEEQICRVQHGM